MTAAGGLGEYRHRQHSTNVVKSRRPQSQIVIQWFPAAQITTSTATEASLTSTWLEGIATIRLATQIGVDSTRDTNGPIADLIYNTIFVLIIRCVTQSFGPAPVQLISFILYNIRRSLDWSIASVELLKPLKMADLHYFWNLLILESHSTVQWWAQSPSI